MITLLSLVNNKYQIIIGVYTYLLEPVENLTCYTLIL